MKIAVLSTPVFVCPPPGYSGLEQLAYQQAVGLAAKGHDVTLFAPDGSTCPGGKVFEFGPAGSWNEQQTYLKYKDELPKFDCIIDHSWLKACTLMQMDGTLKIPCLKVCHAPVDTMFRSLPPNVEKPCFVCISRDQASHFEALFGREARVAYNGVDTDFYRSTGVPRSGRFLFLARFSTIKGADYCQDVCLACNEGLDLVGDVSITNEPDYLEACKKRCDGKQIKMVGPASRAECVWWFSQARAFLHLNARFREPFGLAPVEAMACGNPVLCWKYGAMKETVLNGETGIIVTSVAEAVEAVKSGMLDGMNRGRCREWASQFSVQNMIERYHQLCIEAVDTGGW